MEPTHYSLASFLDCRFGVRLPFGSPVGRLAGFRTLSRVIVAFDGIW